MLFSSITFLYCFLPCVLLVYFAVPDRMKNLVLLLASLFFYGWGEPKYLVFMLASVTQSYIAALLVERFRGTRIAKLALAVSAVASLGLLAYCKYADFFIGNFNAVTGLSIPLLKVALPVGISFYTFQILSYVIDVYRGGVPAQRNFIDLAMYVAMFPQLIAGPIVRYSDIAGSLKNRKTTLADASEGITRFSIGLAKKILLANSAALLVSEFKAYGEKTVLFYWLYAAAYMLHIYFDFSGYSDMAIGLGRIFGFRFCENFNYPYISASITEFWRRWHISLSSWLRDYLYISLGGNRKGKIRQYANLIITMFLGGLWHGASWNFVFWGMLHGVALAAHKFWMGITGRKKGERSHGIRRFFGIVITFHFVCFCWIFFRNADFSTSLDMLNQIFTAFRPRLFTQLVEGYWEVFALMSLGFFLHFVPDSWEHACCKAVIRLPLIGKALLLVAMIYLVIQMKSSEIQPFIYFQF